MNCVGFIGLGAMGRPMALNLRRAGHALLVYARRPQSAAPLLEAGAAVVASAAEMARRALMVFVNVSDDAAVESLLMGDEGLLAAARPGLLVVDMGTTSPAATRRFAALLAERGGDWLDAPVSGGVAGAEAGALSIMAGGGESAFQRALPLLQVLGKNIVHLGESGAGQVAKACNQILVSATLLGVAEAFTFARAQGVDPARVREALLGGFAYSRILEIHGRRMLEENYVPGFRARLHQKDLGIVRAEADALGLCLPASELAARVLDALVAAGDGELDSSALVRQVGRQGAA